VSAGTIASASRFGGWMDGIMEHGYGQGAGD